MKVIKMSFAPKVATSGIVSFPKTQPTASIDRKKIKALIKEAIGISVSVTENSTAKSDKLVKIQAPKSQAYAFTEEQAKALIALYISLGFRTASNMEFNNDLYFVCKKTHVFQITA